MFQMSARFAKLCVGTLFPAAVVFILLLRIAVMLHQSYGVGLWMALATSVLVCGFLLVIYTRLVSRRFLRRRQRRARWRQQIVVASCLLAGYCAYAALSVSGVNVKSAEIRGELRTLHPFLRVAAGTVLFADHELLLPDLARETEDYAKMGLPTRVTSLHYRQDDGYVHAMDVRTKHRSKVRNGLVEAYFRALGFRTLRHIGTADHLHVALPVPPRG